MSNNGVEHQDLQECPAQIPTESDSVTVINLSAMDLVDDDPGTVGQRLRAARESRGWTCEEVGARLKLQARLIRRIEEDDYSGIAHAVYLRGYLTSYARLLDMPVVIAEQVVEECGEQVPLISTGRVSRSRYMLDRYSVSATYLILTALVIGPAVWLATHGGLEQNLARTVMLDAPTALPEALPGSAGNPRDESAAFATSSTDSSPMSAITQSFPPKNEATTDAPPIIASMAPFSAVQPQPSLPDAPVPPQAASVGKHSLTLRLKQSSWVEVTAANGDKLEYGLLEAGVERHYSSDSAVTIRLGNAQGAEIVADGKTIDLAPFRRANVASLRVFSGDEPASRIDS
ncbi:MAG: RodZ domain-containing protein [Dokdonella sp.]